MKKIVLITVALFSFMLNNLCLMAQWTQTNFPSTHQPKWIVSYEGNLFVTAFEKLAADTGGVFKSSDLGSNWRRVSHEINAKYFNRFIAFQAGQIDYFFVGTDSGVYRSTDDGETWYEKNNGTNKIAVAIIEESEGIIFIANLDRTFRSSDFGESWQEIFFGGSSRGIGGLIKKDNYLLAVLFNGSSDFLQKSTDGGITWSAQNAKGLNSNCNTFTGVGNNLYAGSTTIMLKSTDNGLNWNLSQGLPSGYYFLRLKKFNDYLFCVHQTGIYLQHKDSTTWTNTSVTLLPAWIMAGEIDNDNIYASTSDFKLWKRSNLPYLKSIEEKTTYSTQFSLEQIYPNPFSQSTTISYQLPVAGNVKIDIYNSLGEKIATLIDEWQEAGKHNCELRIENYELSAGMYYYTIRIGDSIESGKMIKL